MFTVFTPTWNRARTLPRLYKALLSQTFRDFEWLIVDDGSTDGTQDLVAEWLAKGDIRVRYVWQAHLGKTAAFARAVAEAAGKLFLPIDSDDECVAEALERFKSHWDRIPGGIRRRFSAVTALASDSSGGLIGTRFPQDTLDSDPMELRYRYRVKGDKWGFQRTDVLREVGVFNGIDTSFVPEGVLWTAIAKSFKTRYVNESLLIVHTHVDSGAQRLTDDSPGAHARGMALWHNVVLNDHLGWFSHAPFEFMRSAVHYSRFSLHCGTGLMSQGKALRRPMARGLWAACLPIGWLIYLMDRARR